MSITSGSSVSIASSLTLTAVAWDSEGLYPSSAKTANYEVRGGIAAGWNHAFAFDINRTNTWGWGANSNGQLGKGNTSAREATPLLISATNIVSIDGGSAHSVALELSGTTSSVWTWGLNGDGQLGTGNLTQKINPYKVTFTGNPGAPTAVAAGGYHSLALLGIGGNAWARGRWLRGGHQYDH